MRHLMLSFQLALLLSFGPLVSAAYGFSYNSVPLVTTDAFGCTSTVGCGDLAVTTFAFDGVSVSDTGTAVLSESGEIDLAISVTSLLLEAVDGPDLGVQSILFTSTTYTASGLQATEISAGLWEIDPGQLATIVIGTQTQLDGAGLPVGGTPALFSGIDVSIRGVCGARAVSPTSDGCALTVGPENWTVDVGSGATGTRYFEHSFVLAPEPSTALLVGLGLASLGLSRRANDRSRSRS